MAPVFSGASYANLCQLEPTFVPMPYQDNSKSRDLHWTGADSETTSDHSQSSQIFSRTSSTPTSSSSPGSVLHGTGKCRPCAWFWKPSGCRNGTECSFCHDCPSYERKARRFRRMLAKACESSSSSSVDEDAPSSIGNEATQNCLSTSPASSLDHPSSCTSATHRVTSPIHGLNLQPAQSSSSSPPPPPPSGELRLPFEPDVLEQCPSQQAPQLNQWQVHWDSGTDNADTEKDRHGVLHVGGSRVLLVIRRGMMNAFALDDEGVDEGWSRSSASFPVSAGVSRRCRSCPPRLVGCSNQGAKDIVTSGPVRTEPATITPDRAAPPSCGSWTSLVKQSGTARE